ncbi:helix-turn-helix domain-containing protein, partial [Kineococcus glutinatus]|uniref:PucR family transcriptional regulator n=1 Tax=Kineococcus glutinatus TaxID=1070872 RepID=UPI0031ECDBED
RVQLQRRLLPGAWRAGVGRPGPGAAALVSSYEEARSACDLAERLDLPGRLADAADLLLHQLLLRDRAALTDLVDSLLGPLRTARGGPGPLLDTLDAYFEATGNATAAARRLHLSVRAVTYRLDRVHRLTGHDPDDGADRLALHAAVLGARVLGWPAPTT